MEVEIEGTESRGMKAMWLTGEQCLQAQDATCHCFLYGSFHVQSPPAIRKDPGN